MSSLMMELQQAYYERMRRQTDQTTPGNKKKHEARVACGCSSARSRILAGMECAAAAATAIRRSAAAVGVAHANLPEASITRPCQ